MAIPDKPGLGIEIDPDALNRYGKKFYELTPKGLAVNTIQQRGLINALKLAWAKKRSR